MYVQFIDESFKGSLLFSISAYWIHDVEGEITAYLNYYHDFCLETEENYDIIILIVPPRFEPWSCLMQTTIPHNSYRSS
jgi:hypothetical protein